MSNHQTEVFNEHQQERIKEIGKELQAAAWLVIEAQQRLMKATRGFEGLPTAEEMVEVDPQAYDAEPVEVLDSAEYARPEEEVPTLAND